VQSGGENKTYFENPIGTGPFYVSNYTEGSFQMTMLRNPYYTPQPQISEIDITYVDSKSLTSTPLLSGTTDLAPLEPSNAASILNNPNLRILDQKAFGISTLDYNVSVYPYNMTAFRQALVYGINETQYVQQAFAGYGQPAYSSEGIISPITTWYNPNTIHYDYDQNKAAALLSSIGIVKGSDGYLHYPNGTDVNLVLWAATDNTPDIVGASTIQQNLQALGFNVKVVTTSSSNIISDYGSNIDNIRQAIILYSNYIPIWGLPFTDIEPAWDVYWLPTVVQPYWEYPPSIDAQYQGNYTLFKQTNDPTMVRQTLNKVQQLNAEYLPTIVLAYPDALWGYNIQHWTNWPSGYIEFGSEQFNWTTFEALTPTTAAPITTTSSTSAGFPASYAAAIVVVVLIVVVAAVYSRTRKSKLKE
jgi:ABC-type transport system substrate-binding protein